MNLGHLRCALGVDEVDALEIEYERAAVGVLFNGKKLTNALLERLGSCEEQAAVHAQDGDAGERLVGGVLVEVAEDLQVPACRPSSGIGGLVAIAEPAEREADADHHAPPERPPRERRRSPPPLPRSRIE